MRPELVIEARRFTPVLGRTEAYFDADWLPPGGSGEVPAILATSEELRTTWNDVVVSIGDLSAEDAAALALTATAQEAIAAIGDVPGPIHVIGGGLIAQLVGERLGERLSPGSPRPVAVVDCTGNPELIHAAIAHLDDLGAIVLVGPSPGESLVIDLYPNVHLRGLRIVGVAPPLTDAVLVGTVPDLIRRTFREVAPDGLIGDEGAWYRLPALTDAGTP